MTILGFEFSQDGMYTTLTSEPLFESFYPREVFSHTGVESATL